MAFSPSSSQESCGSVSSSMSGPILTYDFSKHNLSSPELVLLVAPETHFRYRYDTEMSGAHGSLQADRGAREKQIPTVQLIGYNGPAVIRVSLATCNAGQRYPHPHQLFVREKLYPRLYVNLDNKQVYKTGHYIDPHYIDVTHTGNYIGKFEGMCIISSKKENFQAAMTNKLLLRHHHDGGQLNSLIQQALSHVDIAFVSLCFEAFRFDNGEIGDMICPPLYSQPIANAKNASSGKLKITRINKCSGSCQGGDSIWLLVEKINKKGLAVRLYETAMDGTIVWESVVDGDKLELHYQYAVIFNTPPYRDQDITRDVTVSMRLERRIGTVEHSEPETFVYQPYRHRFTGNENIYQKESMFTQVVPNKRPMKDLIAPYPNKRRFDHFVPMDHVPYQYNDQVVQSYEDDDLWNLINETLSPIQVDGAADDKQLVLLKVLQALISRSSKMKDGDVKAVTEKIGRLFLRPDDLKLQDAASTLLSLRSSGVPNKSLHEAVEKEDISTVISSLKAGSDPREVNAAGHTPLHLAASVHHPGILQLLLSHHHSMQFINVQDKNGETALHIAVKNKNLDTVSALVAAGAKVSKKTLDLAEEMDHPDLIKILKDMLEPEPRLVNLTVNVTNANIGTLEKVADIVNRSEKWECLAKLWDQTDVIPDAAKSSNPTMFVFNHMKTSGGVDLESLRGMLDALEEKSAVAIVDEALAKTFM